MKINSEISSGGNKKPTFFQQLDPRSKMLFTALLITGAILLKPSQLVIHLYVTMFLLILTIFSGRSMRYFIRRLSKIYLMIFMITFFLPFQSAAARTDIFLKAGAITIYESGIRKFLLLNLKYIIVILSAMILTAGATLTQLMKGLEQLKLPHWFLAVLTFMFHLIFLLREELERMHTAYKSRCISLPYLTRIRVTAKMTAVYFVRIVGRSERNFEAMISRGFNGRCPTVLELNWRYQDTIITVIGLLFTVGVLMSYK